MFKKFLIIISSIFLLLSCNLQQEKKELNSKNIIPKSIESPFFGNREAKIQLVIFSDFECPACIMFEKVIWDKLITDYVNTNKIGLTFKNFPLSYHQNALYDAHASLCAHAGNKFLEFFKEIYALEEQKSGETVLDEEREQIATKVGLNLLNFQKCMNEGNYIGKIQEDIKLGESMGLNGTPSIYANGKLLKFSSYEQFFQILDQLIKN
ncbi:thioredoxin domain-containing protein [Candidatus Gracilibacteria bacterium]|nr:thioredoxin domain-containing protein [Candidatus Gracilibacteria bacterium]